MLAVPAAAFWPALGHGFFWDDRELIVLNAGIAGLSLENLRWMATSLYMTTWQPLGWLVYALIRAATGPGPAGYHAAALAAHLLASGALFLLLRRILARRRGAAEERFDAPAALAALLFAVHPLQASSAGWATELPDVLAAASALLCARAYLGGARAASWAWFAASCLFRWKAAALPAVLVALDVCVLRRRVDWRRVAPFLILSAATVAVNAAAKSGLYAPGLRLDGIGRGLLLFPLLVLTPWRMLPVYSLSGPVDTLGIDGRLAFALAAALTLLLFLRRRANPALFAAWCCYAALAAAPLLNSQEGVILVFPHHAYLCVLPFFALAAGALADAGGRRRSVAFAAAAALIAGEGVLARAETLRRGEPSVFWTRALALDPSCRAAIGHLAEAHAGEADLRSRVGEDLLAAGLAAEAHQVLAKALFLSPRSERARAGLARAADALGRRDEAQRHRR